jgi:hypothetical protein
MSADPHCCSDVPLSPLVRGASGEEEGQDPTSVSPPMVTVCAFGGEVPTGTNGSDLEDWAA